MNQIKLDEAALAFDDIRLSVEHVTYADEVTHTAPTVYFEIYDPADNKLGFCDLRLFSDERTEINGNIGYTVFPKYRGNSVAVKACEVMKALARSHGMRSLLITCEPENTASAKTAFRAGFAYIAERTIPPEHAAYSRGKRRVYVYEILL